MSNSTLVALLLLLLLLVQLGALAAVSWAQSDCQGKVGAYAYDLRRLAEKRYHVALSTRDRRGQYYFYQVCDITCSTERPSTPAICQLELPAFQYHDLGDQMTARFGQLPNASEGDGFTLSFTGGEDDRASVIHYRCDSSEEDAKLSYINEEPSKTYNLRITSKYACPINKPTPTPTHTPTPTPTSMPPNDKDLCCLYLYKLDPKVTKTLCSSTCPPSSKWYTLESSWTVSACSECFFHRK